MANTAQTYLMCPHCEQEAGINLTLSLIGTDECPMECLECGASIDSSEIVAALEKAQEMVKAYQRWKRVLGWIEQFPRS